MATASWLDPTTRQARLMKKRDLQAMPEMVHKMEEHLVSKMRWEGCNFIRGVGGSLNMFKPALSSACVFFTRFYARNGFLDKKPTAWSESEWQDWRQCQLPNRFKDLHWRFVAAACLFLAGKVEDNPKKIYDLVIHFHKEVPKKEKLVDPELSDMHLRQLKETVFGYERLVLQELEFDTIVEAPVAFNHVAHYIKFMRLALCRVGNSPDDMSYDHFKAACPHALVDGDLDETGKQMLKLAVEFVENSLLTTLWLEYDAPTIALGIAWLTAKFYDFAPATGESWWPLVVERFEHQNKREDPHTGNIFRMKGPSVEVLDDIGLQLIDYHAAAFPERGKPVVPALPDTTTGLAGVAGGEEAGGDALNKEDSISKEKGFYWRHVCFVAEDKAAYGASKRSRPSALSKEGDVLRCTCAVWAVLAAQEVPAKHRTCRCLMCFNGAAAERLRVGNEYADMSLRNAILQNRMKLQRMR